MNEYFYIACSLASLVAFVGYVIELRKSRKDLANKLIGSFLTLTLIFWLWFYLFPENPVKEKIESKTHKVIKFKPYVNGSGEGLVEGTFEISTGYGDGVVFIPSFVEPPTIYIMRSDDEHTYLDSSPIQPINITTDSFSYEIYSSQKMGKWLYKARGKLLEADRE